uniref:F-box domain-containing protein n=1 Tax=Oryza punctata TaxID=4537 RepID=A0A0E0LLY3_ORYPU
MDRARFSSIGAVRCLSISIQALTVSSYTEGHSYGASVLHILTMCTRIAKLTLINPKYFQVEDACAEICICDRLPNWRNENILLKYLEEVAILNCRGEDDEFDLLKLLVRGATGLRRIRIACHCSVADWEIEMLRVDLHVYVRRVGRSQTSLELLRYRARRDQERTPPRLLLWRYAPPPHLLLRRDATTAPPQENQGEGKIACPLLRYINYTNRQATDLALKYSALLISSATLSAAAEKAIALRASTAAGDSAPLSLALGLHLHVHGDGGGGDGVDRLSGLPDGVLANILGQLGDTRSSAATSVLSTRWINLWTLVDIFILRYDKPPDSRVVQQALAAHARNGPTNIRLLEVTSLNSATPNATASWLRVAAPRVTGELFFRNRSSVPLEGLDHEVFAVLDQLVVEQEMIWSRSCFQLPCFTRVTKITLSLGFLGLSLPPSGSFAALRELYLEHVRFNGDYTLDDAMLPFLECLEICKSNGLASLTLRLESLIWMRLYDVVGIRRLDAVVPRLKSLCSIRCFCYHVVDSVSIVAEELEVLRWADFYSQQLFNFNDMPRLWMMYTHCIFSYESKQAFINADYQFLLDRYRRIDHVDLCVDIELEQGEDSTMASMESNIQLPYIRILILDLRTEGHVYGAIVLHILAKCTTIAELTLINHETIQSHDASNLDCICDRPPNWRDTDISMKFLRKAEILNFRGEEHELDLLRVLIRVTPAIRRIRIICHRSYSAWETLSAYIRGFAREATSVEVSLSE